MATKKKPSGDDKHVIFHAFDDHQRGILTKHGAPHSAFMNANGRIDLGKDIQAFSCQLEGVQKRSVGARKQLQGWDTMIENPLGGHYLYVISSYPSETRALQLGLHIMGKATEQYFASRKAGNINHSNMDAPYWHRVMGGFNDMNSFPKDKRPAMLLLSNVVSESTPGKFEKMRDLLVQHDTVPRIILTAAHDPLTFTLEWLRLSPDAVLYVAPTDAMVRTQAL